MKQRHHNLFVQH